VLVAALRRLAILLLLAAAVTVATSALLGVLIGVSIDRAVSLGCYGVGCFLLIAGFFIGNRGPTRVKSETAAPSALPLPLFGSRKLRWATGGEQEETINNSAVFVGLGFAMVVIGALVDSRQQVF
jgi:hypothetical protein